MDYLMKCGHVANATNGGKPLCVICMIDGQTDYATVEKEVSADYGLEGRMSRCTCGAEEPSRWGLPFFKHRPGKETDSHDCGCYGWD